MKVSIFARNRVTAMNILNARIAAGLLPDGIWVVYPNLAVNTGYIAERFGDSIVL